MISPIKINSILLAVILVPACATTTGSDVGSSAAIDAEVEALESRNTTLEVEISRLKSENARLATRMLDLQRQNEKMLAAAGINGEGLSESDIATSLLPEEPQVLAGAPLSDSGAVVDSAGAPELRTGDVPVEPAPRLVQPTFTATDAVFENEVEGEITTTSVLFGVHLASYRQTDEAREGWRKLQRENPDELGLLEPRLEPITIEEKGEFLRLIGGGFSSREKAAALCAQLSPRGVYCSVSGFRGQRLSLASEN